MAYGWSVVLILVLVIGGMEISDLKKQVKAMQKQIDELCNKTGNESEASDYVSDTLKKKLQGLKDEGKIIEAVKELRENTGISLVEAKEYVDLL